VSRAVRRERPRRGEGCPDSQYDSRGRRRRRASRGWPRPDTEAGDALGALFPRRRRRGRPWTCRRDCRPDVFPAAPVVPLRPATRPPRRSPPGVAPSSPARHSPAPPARRSSPASGRSASRLGRATIDRRRSRHAPLRAVSNTAYTGHWPSPTPARAVGWPRRLAVGLRRSGASRRRPSSGAGRDFATLPAAGWPS
jgi:hypothetical protein